MARLEMLSFLPINTLIAHAQNDHSIDSILPPYKVCDWGFFTYTKFSPRYGYTGYMILSANPGWYVGRRSTRYISSITILPLSELSTSVKNGSPLWVNYCGLITSDMKMIESDDYTYEIVKSLEMDGLESFLFAEEIRQPASEPYVKKWSNVSFTRPLYEWEEEIVGYRINRRVLRGSAGSMNDPMSASLLPNGCYIFYYPVLFTASQVGCFKYDPTKQGVPGEKPWSYDPDWKTGLSLDC